MCRLLGFVSQSKISFREIVGEDLDHFVSLSHEHPDGWGIAAAERETQLLSCVRAAEIAAESSTFAKALQECVSDGALLHLRRATGSLAVVDSNAHPFVCDQYTFMHNGCITPTTAVDGFIAPDLLTKISGTTDSERYFMLVLTEIRKVGLVPGIRAAIATIASTAHSYSSINAMMLTADTFVVISEHFPHKRPACESDDYYTLRFRRDENGGIVVGSSGWHQDGWETVPNNTIMLVNRSTLAIELHSVF